MRNPLRSVARGVSFIASKALSLASSVGQAPITPVRVAVRVVNALRRSETQVLELQEELRSLRRRLDDLERILRAAQAAPRRDR